MWSNSKPIGPVKILPTDAFILIKTMGHWWSKVGWREWRNISFALATAELHSGVQTTHIFLYLLAEGFATLAGSPVGLTFKCQKLEIMWTSMFTRRVHSAWPVLCHPTCPGTTARFVSSNLPMYQLQICAIQFAHVPIPDLCHAICSCTNSGFVSSNFLPMY